MIRSQIVGWGSYLPGSPVDNHTLSRQVDTDHEWIVQRTGIRQRYIAARGPISKDEFTGFMMTVAFYEFLKEQQVEPNFVSRVPEFATLAG